MRYPQVNISQQNDSLKQQQIVVKDSLAIRSSLRTPILEIEHKQPAYLKKQAAQPQRVIHEVKPALSPQDSLQLNISGSKQGEGAYFFVNSLSPYAPAQHTPGDNHSLPSVSVKTPTEISKDTSEADSTSHLKRSETFVEKTEQEAVKARAKQPFDGHKEWISGLIILALLIAGFVRLTSHKYLNELFSAIRFQHSASKLFSTVNVQNQKPIVALTTLFFITTALMIYEFIRCFGPVNIERSGFNLYVLLIAGLIIFFLSKVLCYRFAGYIFGVVEQTKEYLFNSSLLSQAYGIALLPVVSIVPFVNQGAALILLKGGLGLFIFMYIVQLIRGAKIILRTPISIFYMFLYFCALEILPLSILIKVLMF